MNEQHNPAQTAQPSSLLGLAIDGAIIAAMGTLMSPLAAAIYATCRISDRLGDQA